MPACTLGIEFTGPPCTYDPVDVEPADAGLSFTAAAALAAASVTVDDVTRVVPEAFVDAASADAWDGLDVHVEHTFTQVGLPTVVEFPPDAATDPDATCPLGPALRIPVRYHADARVGDAVFTHDLALPGFAMFATGPTLDDISFDDPGDSVADDGTTTVDPASERRLRSVLRRCPAAAHLTVGRLPSDLEAGVWAREAVIGGVGAECPDTGGSALMFWGPDPSATE